MTLEVLRSQVKYAIGVLQHNLGDMLREVDMHYWNEADELEALLANLNEALEVVSKPPKGVPPEN